MQQEFDVTGVPEMSVAEFSARLEKYLLRNPVIQNLGIQGEISEWRPQENGGIYFRLKDEYAIIDCYAFANKARSFPDVANGTAVVALGSVGIRKKKSTYQLLVNGLRLTGIGNLHQQFEKLKEKFRAEGLFERARKRKLPRFPQRVAVVSARGGKAIDDFLTTVRRRAPFVKIEFLETRIQGDGAEIEIADAIDRASRMNVDVIVLTRGGGSYEELFPFNTEPVVRAILRASHPVISAVGHEPDHHLSDDVADFSCETPSNAAQYFGELGDSLVRDVSALNQRLDLLRDGIVLSRLQRVDEIHDDLQVKTRQGLSSRSERVHMLLRRLDAHTPQKRLSERAQRLARAEVGLAQQRPHALRAARNRLDRLLLLLHATDPHALLARGYAIVTFEGRAVLDASAVPDGARIEAKVQRGRLKARVEEKVLDG